MDTLGATLEALTIRLSFWQGIDDGLTILVTTLGLAGVLIPLFRRIPSERRERWAAMLSSIVVILGCFQCQAGRTTSRISDQRDGAQRRADFAEARETRERIKGLNLKAAESRRYAARLKSELLPWRQIEGFGETAAVAKLLPFAGQAVEVVGLRGWQETLWAASVLAGVLGGDKDSGIAGAGWRVTRRTESSLSVERECAENAWTSVEVAGPGRQDSAAMSALVAVLEDAKWRPAPPRDPDESGTPRIRVVVCPKYLW